MRSIKGLLKYSLKNMSILSKFSYSTMKQKAVVKIILKFSFKQRYNAKMANNATKGLLEFANPIDTNPKMIGMEKSHFHLFLL